VIRTSKDVVIEWTGFTSSGDCIFCKEIDKKTLEFESPKGTFFACEECMDKKVAENLKKKGVDNGL